MARRDDLTNAQRLLIGAAGVAIGALLIGYGLSTLSSNEDEDDTRPRVATSLPR